MDLVGSSGAGLEMVGGGSGSWRYEQLVVEEWVLQLGVVGVGA